MHQTGVALGMWHNYMIKQLFATLQTKSGFGSLWWISPSHIIDTVILKYVQNSSCNEYEHSLLTLSSNLLHNQSFRGKNIMWNGFK